METNKIILTKENIDSIRQMASSMTTPLIIYINQVIDMNGTPLSLADGTVYRFEDGGMIKNTVVYGGIQIEAKGLAQIFDNATVPDMLNNEVPIEWFGGVCYTYENSIWQTPGTVFSDQALADAVVSRRGRKILFMSGYYFFHQMVEIANQGIILSGTMAHNRINGIRNDYSSTNDSVSTLAFYKNSSGTFIRITCNETRLENLLLHEMDFSESNKQKNTAVELTGDAISIYADRCMFYNWGYGIYKAGSSSSGNNGLSRCIINECFFFCIKNTAIEAKVDYITYNIIRDSWLSMCGCPIYLKATSQLLQDNSIDNCNIDCVKYSSNIYNTYNCCAAIYLESGSQSCNYATNNISRCYFEHIGYDENFLPPSTCDNTAAVISKNTSITVDNNFFTSTPWYFVIDKYSSLSIKDNSIGIIHSMGNNVPPYDTLIQVKSTSTLTKNIQHSIVYSNSIPIPPDSGNSFITKLVNFSGTTGSNFRVKNLFETRFTDYLPLH